MTQVTAVIAEDELPQREELRGLLEELWPELVVVEECGDGLSALEAINTHRPQVVFLDIRMPGLSGLEVARAAGEHAQVIFITAYQEHALDAFDKGAVDYLLKPIARDRLQRALDRTRARIRDNFRADITTIINSVQQQLSGAPRHGIKWITASVGSTVRMYSVDEVLFFQAQDKYTRVVTVKDEAFIRTPLKELVGALDAETFWQIHRSCIVRVSAIHAVERDGDGRLSLSLRGRADRLPVSSAFQHRFKGM
jgi:DNA-binding LytR/AlgR family response regulator